MTLLNLTVDISVNIGCRFLELEMYLGTDAVSNIKPTSKIYFEVEMSINSESQRKTHEITLTEATAELPTLRLLDYSNLANLWPNKKYRFQFNFIPLEAAKYVVSIQNRINLYPCLSPSLHRVAIDL